MFFCLMQGATLALLSITFSLACWRAFEPTTGSHHGAIALAAIFFSLCGAVTQTIKSPHPEVLIPAGIFLSTYLMTRYRYRVGGLVLLPVLLIREDAGIYAGFLFFLIALLAVDRDRDRQMWRWFIVLGALASAYSASSFALKSFVPGHDVAAKILGSPPLAHVDADFLLMRLATFGDYGEAYWLAALVMATGSVLSRSWIPSVATLALAPTSLLTAMALADVVAEFQLQYGYPLVLMIAWWPLAMVFMARRGVERRLSGRSAAIVLALLIGTGHLHSNLERYLLHNSWLRSDFDAAAKLEAAAGRIGRELTTHEGVLVDHAGVALRPDLFLPHHVRDIDEGPRSDARVAFCFEPKFDDWCAPTMTPSGLDDVYRLEGTVLLAAAKDHKGWLEQLGFIRIAAEGQRPGR